MKGNLLPIGFETYENSTLEALNPLDRRCGQAAGAMSLSATPDALDRFDPGQHFTALLERACGQASDTRFRYQRLSVYCYPGPGVFLSLWPLEELLPLVKAKPAEITQETIHPMPDFEQIKAAGWKRYDLSELRWFAALVSSQGRLHKEIDPAEPLHLRSVPNCVRLPYYRKYAAIAEFLATAAEPVAKVAAATGCAATEVADFANACHVLKLLMRGREALDVCAVQQAARQRIKSLCVRFSEQAGEHVKLVFIGSIGAGKTTAIGQLSEHPAVLTEARPSDATQLRKGTTTVAMDYGHISCPKGFNIHLYGTPGQRRFYFMGQILAQNASAIVIFISNIEDDPLAELMYHINQCRHSPAQTVVAVTHSDIRQTPAVADYERALKAEGLAFPVVVADPRNPGGLVEVFERLFAEKAPSSRVGKRPATVEAGQAPKSRRQGYVQAAY